ncbi:MAG TPA: polysaccharide deacetylase family protein [Rudaea sp.]|nr:polysaccharide deacetylase family protein [Rudaea sp.]
MKHACIALHDVAPATWPLCMRVFEMLAEFGGAPLTLLVVPDFHGRGRVDAAPEFVRAIETRLARGDEVALHGYDHRDSAAPPRTPLAWLRRRVLTAGEGEFSALARNEASARLERGLALMQRLRWPVRGFVPPAWLASCDVRAVLHESGLDYTTTHGSLIDLRRRSAIAAPCITASPRSPWRRAASRGWLKLGAAATAPARLVRIGIHPADAEHPELMASWRELLRTLLDRRAAVTKSTALEHARAGSTAPAFRS